MANYTRVKTWIAEKLFAADLNAEFNAVQAAVNGIDAEQINANAVTTAKILDANVTTPKLLDAGVTQAKILNGAATGSVGDAPSPSPSVSSPFSNTTLHEVQLTAAAVPGNVLLLWQANANMIFSPSPANVYWYVEIQVDRNYPSTFANLALPGPLVAEMSRLTGNPDVGANMAIMGLDTDAPANNTPSGAVRYRARFVPVTMTNLTTINFIYASLTAIELRR